MATSSTIILRPARVSDYKIMGRIAAITSFPTTFTNFLAPHRVEHYWHYERDVQRRALLLQLDPRARSIVACEASKPDVPIGHVHIGRLGDDEGAQRVIREKASVRLWALRWLAWAWYLVLGLLVGGNKAADPKALKVFSGWVVEDNDTHWKKHKERDSRWHVQGFVVLPMYQRRGIGRRLMEEVTKLAAEDNVIVGLEGSIEGEPFYRSYGFEFLGKFTQHAGYEFLGNGGGFFMWTPPALKAQVEKKES